MRKPALDPSVPAPGLCLALVLAATALLGCGNLHDCNPGLSCSTSSDCVLAICASNTCHCPFAVARKDMDSDRCLVSPGASTPATCERIGPEAMCDCVPTGTPVCVSGRCQMGFPDGG